MGDMESQPKRDRNPVIKNVDAVFAGLPDSGTAFNFAKAGAAVPRGGHLQGIQAGADGSFYVLSGSSNKKAYLATVAAVNLKTTGIYDITPTGFPTLTHAGGFQLIGDFLVVGLENDQNSGGSVVALYETDGSSMTFNRNLAVRPHKPEGKNTAGAVGIVKLTSGEFLLVVGTWDCKTVDIYRSNAAPLADKSCKFGHIATWEAAGADKTGWIDANWGSYQSMNLFCDTGGNVFMTAFNRNETSNFVDLFLVDPAVTPDTVQRCFLKRAKKRVSLKAKAKFRYSAGIWLRNENNITLLASARSLHKYTIINLV